MPGGKMHSEKTVKPQALIDIGLTRAIFWNTDLNKEVDSQAFIVSTLIKGYNDFIIEKLVEYFGSITVMESVNKYRDRVSDKLVHAVENFTHTRLASA